MSPSVGPTWNLEDGAMYFRDESSEKKICVPLTKGQLFVLSSLCTFHLEVTAPPDAELQIPELRDKLRKYLLHMTRIELAKR